jgi:uncharacterized membrane protein YqjE
MDEQEPRPPEPPASLQRAALHLGARTLELAETRLALASVELAEARERLLTSLLLIGAMFACSLLALMVATFGIIAWFWESHRFGAIAGVLAVYVVAAAVLWQRVAALRRDAPALFAATLDTLRRDAARLRGDDDDVPA